MTPETIAAGALGLGILAANLLAGWQSVQAKREAKHANRHAETAAENSKPVSNGFTAKVEKGMADILAMATDARDTASRAEDMALRTDEKMDRHLEAHANAQVYDLRRKAQ